MNLLEIILTLHELSNEKRKQLLKEWDVEPALWGHIQHLFTDDGKFTPEAKTSLIDFLYHQL
jgi:hypothetical protein